jgi:hypothetical protein
MVRSTGRREPGETLLVERRRFGHASPATCSSPRTEIAELELNPVFVLPHGATAADVPVADRGGAQHPWSRRRSEDFRPYLAALAASTLKL